MSVAVLDRPAKPCGCPPSAASGLGQKVKIMAGVASSGAGGQTVHIQLGTGKSSVGRRSQTVHIRGEQTPCLCQQIVFDDFDREVEEGWDFSTPTHVEWFYTGFPFVSGGRGGLSTVDDQVFTEVDVAVTPDPAVLDMYFRFQFAGGFPPSGYFSIIAAPGSAARLEIRCAPQDSGDSVLHLEFIGDDSPTPVDVPLPALDAGPSPVEWRCHLYTDLTTLKVKAWPDGDDEPSAWQGEISTTDPTYDPNPEYLYFSIDGDFLVWIWDITFGSCMYDSFHRPSEPTDWGAATPTGNVYEYPDGIPAGATLSTNGNYGIANIAADTATVNIRMPAYPMWADPEGFVGTYEFSTQEIPGTGDDVRIALFHGTGGDPPFNVEVDISSDPAYGLILVYDTVLLDQLVITDWVEFTDYRVKFERRPLDSILRAKVWAIADAEPDWMVATTTSNADPLESFMQFALDNLTDASYALYFNDITFDKCPYVPPTGDEG